MLRRRDRKQRARIPVDVAQAGAQHESRIPGQVGDVRQPRASMLLVSQHGIAACRGERLVAARRVDEAPVEIARVPHDVIRPLRRRVAGMAEALDPGDRPRLPAQVRKRTGPDADAADVGPPERAEKDGCGRLRCEAEHDVDAALRRLLLVPALERLEDALAARLLGGRCMDGEAGERRVAAEHHLEQRVRGDTDDAAVRSRDGHQRACLVFPEPPVEFRAGQREVAPRILEQP